MDRPAYLVLMSTTLPPPLPRLAAESPAEPARNALMVLKGVETTTPTFWSHVPELARAVRRAHAAVSLLESGVRPTLAVPHLEAAVRALADADPVAWGTCPEISAACTLLLRAFFGALGA